MASKRVLLRWTGEGEQFRGGPEGGPSVLLDGKGGAAPSPMDFLLISLAGCMGIDVVLILQKARVPVEELEVVVDGDRPDTSPRRYTALRLEYRVRGPGEEHQTRLERAVALSRDKYCSVLHTLRTDLDVEIRIRRM